MRKVTLTPSSPPGAPAVVIFDGTKAPLPDGCEDGFAPKLTRQLQIAPLIDQPYQFVADRQNALVRLSFTVTHSFTTALAARTFNGQRAATLPGSGTLIIQTQAEGQNDIAVYKGAFLESAECLRDVGRSLVWRYSFVLNVNYSTQL